MKRFHVHISVADLSESVRFYSSLFGAQPSVEKDDYAKWLLDDPAVNFAISSRGAPLGVNHLGVQVDATEQLTQARDRARKADIKVADQTGAACCYARSDKYWIEDPQGIAWETFHTLGDIPVFGAGEAQADDGGCCVPAMPSSETEQTTSKSGCCG